jgi:hypothetical protein
VFVTGIIIFSFVGMQVMGCAAIKLSPYLSKPFSSFTNTIPQDDLHVAIQPMTDKAEQEKHFGRDLTGVGILPVYIIAQNRHPSKSFVLNSDIITLQNKTTKATCPKPLKTDAADTSGGETMIVIGSCSLILTPLIIGFVLFLVLNANGGKAVADATVIHNGLVANGLYTRTISPGKSAEGFVYFKLPDSKANIKELSLIVPASELGTKSVHNLEFAL